MSTNGERAVILVLVKGLGIGGAEMLIAEGARFWDRDRFEYHVAYVLPWKDQLVAALEALDVPVHLLSQSGRTSPLLPLKLRRLVRRIGADVVHAHLPYTGILARVAAGVPVVYTEHNLADSYRLPTRAANRATYRANAATIAVSDAVAASIAGYHGNPVVVPNGVVCVADAAAPASVRDELQLPPGRRLVVHVGNIRPGKGHDNLVDAAALLQRGGADVFVASMGVEKFEGDLARLRDRVRDMGLEGTVAFLGRREDALAFTAAADVYVNPSSHEGLPVAVLEAMSLGRPIVATAVGGVPSVIHDRETGILVPPGDPEALAAAIAEVAADPDLARRLGTAARHLVETEFGLDKMVSEVESIYEQVLTDRD